MKTVVGLYKSVAEANRVKIALASEGYANEHITVIDQTGGDYSTGSSYTGHDRDAGIDTGSIGGKIKHFFSGLTGGEDESTSSSYTQGVSGGGALLAVTVPDNEAERTADMLFQHGATGIEGGSGSSLTGSGSTGSSYGQGTGAEDVAVLEGTNRGGSYAGTAATSGEQVIPIVEEDLVVGKREVTRGGVRIYSHVTERPVSAEVTLHDERIVVDRHPVNREATAADFNTGAGVVELTATGEEAVVGKRSRVVEEVLVGKESSQHTEQVTDTVRRTEVDVEPTTTVNTGSTLGSTGTKTGNRF